MIGNRTILYGKHGIIATLALLALITSPGAAQFPPDSFTNLQVLPETIAPRELVATMRGFALGLGVRCHFCHVGEEGIPLSQFDFASDEKATKAKAREMLQMVKDINTKYLAALTDRPEPHVTVQCATCHRGQSRPLMLEDVLRQTIAQHGLDSAKAEYRSLRETYYGSYTYDFSELTLNLMAQSLADQQEIDNAIGMLELNEEFYPESAGVQFLMGEAYRAKGDREQAITRFERALELNPTFRQAQRRLDELRGR
jgi:hypothetical protein